MIRAACIAPGLLLGGLSLCGPAHAHMSTTADWSGPAGATTIITQETPSQAAMRRAPNIGWDLANIEDDPVALPDMAYGPLPEASLQPTGRTPRYVSLGSQVGAVKYEFAALAAYITVSQILVTRETRPFHFKDEGWFGKSTTNLGVDKLTHAYNAYLLTEFFQARIKRKNDGASGGALAAAVLASGLMAYSELYDAHKESSGWSNQDVLFNLGGAGFSVLRNTVPGLKDKLDFRLMVIPNSDIYTFKGKRHYEQQRFLLALQLSGFDNFKETPFRFIEIHAGYYAKNFTDSDRERGKIPQRKLFFGIGLNLQHLFFKQPRSTAGRVAGTALEYLQIPYTAVHVD